MIRPPPGGAEMQRYLARNFVVRRDVKERFFATLELQTSQPAFARRFFVLLNQAANDHLGLAATGDKSPRDSIARPGGPNQAGTLAGCEAQSQPQFAISTADRSSDPVAAQLLGAPSIQPDPADAPLKSVLTALLLGAGAGVACRLAIRWLTTGRHSKGAGDDMDRLRRDTVV